MDEVRIQKQTIPGVKSPPADDSYPKFGVTFDGDGMVTRIDPLPRTRASVAPDDPAVSPSKDIQINPDLGTWVRLYVPPNPPSPSGNKFPIIVYIHGGGFVYLSAATTPIHDFCSLMSATLLATVVSVDYRRAPEHRLPAAYDDVVEVLHWIRRSNEDWLDRYADLSSCYIMGTSAGGNIAYHAGLMACDDEAEQPLKIKGLIAHCPFFGGLKRTASELRSFDHKIMPLAAVEFLWELSLPIGADRDHEYCNLNSGHKLYERMESLKWKVMVIGGDGDPLIDRQREFATMLEEKGVKVVAYFSDNAHADELDDVGKAAILFEKIKEFMNN